VTTPRAIRLLRVPDLQTLHAVVARVAGPAIAGATTAADPLAARDCAVIVPTRGAAEALRRTLENRALAAPGAVTVLPDLLTRADFYARLHQHLPGVPQLLSEFEREVLVRRAARLASESGAPAPFRLRAGLIVEILSLYDDLRRRRRTVEDFERLMTGSLEPGADTDRGAERMLRQTRFLVTVFRELERRIAATGRIDEHGLRARLVEPSTGSPYRRVVVTVGDQAGDARGLWLADYDVLARVSGIEHIDIVATEHVLAAGLHERMHSTFPGLEEERVDAASALPVLVAPERPAGQPDVRWFVSRDREEELADFVRGVKEAPVSERTALVFQRPLPYLYLARSVFADARVPYQALDARPLAAEPFAAALDLVFEVAMSEATRAPLVDLIGSPHWTFGAGSAGENAVDPSGVAALDAWLREIKYLGGWDRLEALACEPAETGAHRTSRLRRQAQPAVQAVAEAAREVRSAIEAPKASAQVERLVTFIKRHERLPDGDDPAFPDHVRARAAILGALGALAAAHAAHDDEPLLVTELANTVRRWIEGQTFSPRTGTEGVTLLDAQAAAYADVDDVRLIGLVESDWPERSRRSIFYPASLLGQLGWPNEIDRLIAARARFHDLLRLARARVSVSTFTLEEDAIVAPSAFLEGIDSCGLDVKRAERATRPRAFVQEALREAPVVPDPAPGAPQLEGLALRGTQAEWLLLRASRSPITDPAFHGTTGARAPMVYAVSHVERYLDCPFKYFSSYVLGLEEERDEDAGLSPRERGQFLHEVFQQFFVAWEAAGHRSITADRLQEAQAIFETVVEAHLATLSDADRALERTYLLGSAAAAGLAERAFGFEIEQGVGVIERLLEHQLEGEFALLGEGGPVRLRIRGKADRIDLLDDGTLRVVDYKLGRAPKAARALQLPVYGACATQQLEGRHGRSWPISRAGYVAFREKNAFVSLGATAAQAAQALEDGQRRMVASVAAIEHGLFPVDPDEPFLCTRCGYAGVCRKDYVGDE
jgi:RecB family exonuclease